MSCRLPAAIHVPLNSCHSESSEVDSACAGDAAPSPASISATKRRDDLCQPSLQRCHAAARRLRPLTIIRHPHQSAANRDIFRLPIYSQRNTCTGSKSYLDVDQLRPDARGPPAGLCCKRRGAGGDGSPQPREVNDRSSRERSSNRAKSPSSNHTRSERMKSAIHCGYLTAQSLASGSSAAVSSRLHLRGRMRGPRRRRR